MGKANSRNVSRAKRHMRVRKKVSGTSDRPRLNVYKSLNHTYAQVIDDVAGVTLVSASTVETELKGEGKSGGNVEFAKAVGNAVAKKAIDKGITKVVFDRGGFIYHGRIKAVADAARATGLEF